MSHIVAPGMMERPLYTRPISACYDNLVLWRAAPWSVRQPLGCLSLQGGSRVAARVSERARSEGYGGGRKTCLTSQP